MPSLKSTKPKLGTCARCKKIVLAAWSDGLLTVVDVAPLDGVNYRVALIAKQWTYDVLSDSTGKPVKLKKRTQFSSWAEDSKIVREHACKLVTVHFFEAEDTPKAKPPVSFSSVRKAFVPDYSGVKRGIPAETATRSPSRPARCDSCRQRVYTGDPDVVSIECGTYLWASHVECSRPT